MGKMTMACEHRSGTINLLQYEVQSLLRVRAYHRGLLFYTYKIVTETSIINIRSVLRSFDLH